MPITAKMKMIISNTNVKFDKAGKVFAIIVRMSFKDFQDLASLKTLRSLKDLNIDKPSIPSNRTSTKERATIIKSKIFHLS
jgi:hypothetical protein